MNKYLGSTGLQYLWDKIKALFARKKDLDIITGNAITDTKLGDGTTSDDTHGEIRNATGRTVVWNNIVPNNIATSITIPNNGTGQTILFFSRGTGSAIYPTHKYLLRSRNIDVTNMGGYHLNINSPSWKNYQFVVNGDTIITPTDAVSTGAETQIFLYTNANAVAGTTITGNFAVFDLTQMFGAGNEPSTVEEFEALFPLDYYAYNVGTMLGGTVTGFKSTDADGNTLSNLSIPITTMTGKRDGSSTSEVMFPYGLNGIGGVKDEMFVGRKYQELEYIESDGTQRIDLDISGNCKFKLTAQSSVVTSANTVLVCSTDGASGGTWFGCTANGKWGSSAVSGEYTSVECTTKANITVSFVSGTGNSGTVNGESFARSNTNTNYQWRIFSVPSHPHSFSGKLFSLQATQNNVMVLNLIPARRMYDGAIGMYDTLNDKFYANAGTGTFTAGNVVREFTLDEGRIAVRRIGVVDMGSLAWANESGSIAFRYTLSDAKGVTDNARMSYMLCKPFLVYSRSYQNQYTIYNSISITTSKLIIVYTSDYTSAEDFKSAMSGELLYYELETPIEYTIDTIPVTSYKTRKGGKEMWLPAHGSAPTVAPVDWSTAYGMNAVEEIDNKAPLASPALTGTPTAPTAPSGTNTTQIATTAFVQDLVASLQKAIEMLTASTVVVEGHLRVAGSSDPALSYRTYALDDNVQQGVQVKRESVFHIFHPCLVGNNLTGNVGKILHVLQKLGARTAAAADSSFTEGQAIWLDTDGMPHAIDGSEGDVMVVNTEPYWQIAGHYDVDNTTLDVFLRSRQPFTWNGIEAVKEEPWGDAPDFCVAHSDDGTMVMHSVYNPSWEGSYTAPYGVTGRYVVTEEDGELVETYDSTATMLGGSGGLHTTDIALYTGEQYAMNMNADNTKTVPYYNHHARRAELLWAGLAAEGGTFDSHKKELFGSGFSSNDAANDATYGSGSDARNGLRIYDKDNTAKYYGFSSNVRFLKAESSGTQYGCFCVNAYRNAWHCMEAYRVLCHAVSNGIAELEWFAFEGNRYKWRSVSGYDGPAKGEATAVVFKMMSTKAHADAVDPTDLTTSIAGNRIDVVVSTGLWHGITTQVSPSWWTSGLIFTEGDDGGYEAYMERNQEKLIKSESSTINTSEQFDFEKQYLHVGSFANGNGYRKNYANDCLMLPDSDANKSGAALHTYVGAYNYFSGTAPAAGKKSSRGFRRGAYANVTALSPLFVGGAYAPSGAASGCAFGTCVRIES